MVTNNTYNILQQQFHKMPKVGKFDIQIKYPCFTATFWTKLYFGDSRVRHKRLSDCPGQVKCVFGQVKTAPNLSDRASDNVSVICSILEEQND